MKKYFVILLLGFTSIGNSNLHALTEKQFEELGRYSELYISGMMNAFFNINHREELEENIERKKLNSYVKNFSEKNFIKIFIEYVFFTMKTEREQFIKLIREYYSTIQGGVIPSDIYNPEFYGYALWNYLLNTQKTNILKEFYANGYAVPYFFKIDQSNNDLAALFVRTLLEKCLIEYGCSSKYASNTEWLKNSIKFEHRKNVSINFTDIKNIFGNRPSVFFLQLRDLLKYFISDDENFNTIFSHTKNSPFRKVKDKDIKYYKNLLKKIINAIPKKLYI